MDAANRPRPAWPEPPALLVRASDVTLGRPGATEAPPLLSAVRLDVFAGDRLGLVGPSGAGKSTLLRVLASRVSPTEGRVVRPPGVRIAYLPQTQAETRAATVWQVAEAALADVRAAEARMRDAETRLSRGEPGAEKTYALAISEHDRLGGYGAESELREVLHALGLPRETWERPAGALSVGQRRRLALASVLAAPADLLLLDEPTNHLDVKARVWLEGYLARGDRACVIVSHDRALLTAATTETLFLTAGKLQRLPGGYERAAKREAAQSAARTRRAAEMRREAVRLEAIAAELAREGRRAKARERGAAELARRSTELSAGIGNDVTVRLSSGAIGAAGRRRRLGWLLHAEDLSAEGLFSGTDVRLERGDRIALLGPNGSGKSTLLAILAGSAPPGGPLARLEYAPGMRLAHVGQEGRGLAAGVPVIDQLATPLGEDLARSRLAAAGIPYTSWSVPPERLSGGERARVGLALALALEPDLLLLDEPDNDLDLYGVEALEAALDDVAGAGTALVVATHDRHLATRVLERAWEIRDGALVAYGSVRAYLRGEEPVPAASFWKSAAVGTADAPGDVAPEDEVAEDPALALEAERDRLLAVVSDPVGATERDRARARRRLAEVEGELVSLIDAGLAPPEPRYRFREAGIDVHADAIASGHWRLVAAPDPVTAVRELAEERPRYPAADLRSVGEVAHLALAQPQDACYLPHGVGPLLDAGVRLAFTVAGATLVQAFLGDRPVSPTRLVPAPDGWWFADVETFLAGEGWSVAKESPRRARRGKRRRGGKGGGR